VESRAATRQAILKTARHRFALDGFGGTSIDAIAAEAGFSKGAVYSNFENKEQLFIEVVKSYRDDLLASVMPLFKGKPTHAETVDRLAKWADRLANGGKWTFLTLEYARHAGADSKQKEAQTALLRENWLLVGEQLRPMFRDDFPADAEMLGTLVFELAHAPLSGLTTSPTVGALIRLTFSGLLAAYGIAETL